MKSTYILSLKTVTTDFRFWLFIFFIIRMETINLPPLDEHSWRQCITLGVAKSYLEVDASFFEPKTIICDSRDGIFAQEFPLLNYIIFLSWKVFGVNNWSFRLINLIISTIGLYYFFLLTTRLFDKYIGFASSVIFAVSVAFIYARKAMPDVFAVSLCIIGIEYGYRYLDHKKISDILFFTLFLSLGLLSKMPAALVIPFGIFMFSFKKENIKSEFLILLGGTISVVLMIIWYFLWVPWAENRYQFRLFYPTSFKEGFEQLIAVKADLRLRFYPIALTGSISFIACLVGLVMAIIKKNSKILLLLGFSTLLLIFFMLKTGAVFAGHAYYIIPFVPMMSLLAGYGVSIIKKYKFVFYLLLIIISIEAISIHKPDFFISSENKKFLKLSELSDKFIPKDSRILVNGGNGQPWMMYFANRRGWSVDDRMKDTAWVNGESTVGLKYMIIDKSKWQDSIPYKVLYDDIDFRIYKVVKD